MEVSPTDTAHLRNVGMWGWVHSIKGGDTATDWHTISGSPLSGTLPNLVLVGVEGTPAVVGFRLDKQS
ncbi:hypothetical protein ABIB25_004572 [Nakamurella sp. UYEF19]|uniref:hypothetical protein n=1 Tax=Nakamurella sp. UYEF19 TaxID=1756392 RepID=UPI003399DF01